MKKLKYISLWLSIILYLFIVLGLATDKSEKTLCNEVNICIIDSLNNSFVDKEDVLTMLGDKNINLLGTPVNTIDTKNIEDVLLDRSLIKNAQVYKTIDGQINIEVDQRQPILRIIDKYNRSYYMDEDGSILPTSNKYSSHVLIANGHFEKPKDLNNVNDVANKLVNKKNEKLLIDIYKLAKFIHANEFMEAQIEQVYVNEDFQFELIPRVGAHIIIFGDIQDYEEKFRKLKALYLGGFNNVGWNQYEKINLKYKNQVVCTKK